jgi:hypothetical protein
VNLDFVAVLDVEDFELKDETVAMLVHMKASGYPPLLMDDPILADGEILNGCWVLTHWDDYEHVGVYYPIEYALRDLTSGTTDLTEGDAHRYLESGDL